MNNKGFTLISGEICYPAGMDEITVAAAAIALGVDESTIRARIRRGDMQATRIGARVLVIPASEVERWRAIGKARTGPKPRPAP